MHAKMGLEQLFFVVATAYPRHLTLTADKFSTHISALKGSCMSLCNEPVNESNGGGGKCMY